MNQTKQKKTLYLTLKDLDLIKHVDPDEWDVKVILRHNPDLVAKGEYDDPRTP